MRVGSYIHYTYDAAGTLLRKGYYVGEELTEIPGDDEEELTGFRLPDTHLMSVGDEEEEKELVEEEEEEIPYTDVIDYCGNCIYENGTLKMILIEDGYVTFDSNSQPVYHFYLQDHLGNNRVVANASGQVEQVNHYYPYGGLMAESTGCDVQRYKYNGKELDRMLGLDWYDYGARHYDGALTMWGTMDPLCEKNPDVTPYHYCHNNPFNRVDPDGKDDYYNRNGVFLGTNNAKTDNIYITNEGQYRQIKDGRYIINIHSRVALDEAELDADAYSKIFTNCFKLGGGDCSELVDGMIQITVWQNEGGKKVSYNSTEKSNNDGNATADTNRDHTNGALITAYIWPLGTEERQLFSTRSNINSTIIDHEYKGHYEKGLVHKDGVPDPIYKIQKRSINWEKATLQYQEYYNKIIKQHGWE